MAVSKRLRFEILRRDNHTCRYCGATTPGVRLVVDHVVPETLGGRSEPENLVTACEACNNGKSSVPPDATTVANVSQDAIRWARALAQARAIRRLRIEEREAYVNYFNALWAEWTRGGQSVPLDDDWRASLARFFEYEVEPEDLKHAVETAMASTVPVGRTFRYFCGVVWRIIRQLQEAATDIAMADLADEVEHNGWED
jgi:hypothetical protein